MTIYRTEVFVTGKFLQYWFRMLLQFVADSRAYGVGPDIVIVLDVASGFASSFSFFCFMAWAILPVRFGLQSGQVVVARPGWQRFTPAAE